MLVDCRDGTEIRWRLEVVSVRMAFLIFKIFQDFATRATMRLAPDKNVPCRKRLSNNEVGCGTPSRIPTVWVMFNAFLWFTEGNLQTVAICISREGFYSFATKRSLCRETKPPGATTKTWWRALRENQWAIRTNIRVSRTLMIDGLWIVALFDREIM